MNGEHSNPSHRRRLQLPSGREICVQYFDSTADSGDEDLGLCGTCGCTLMQPIDAAPIGERHARTTLRCPNCGWVGTAVFSAEAMQQFAEMRARDVAIIRSELEQISLANMMHDAERFVLALDHGHILPSDF